MSHSTASGSGVGAFTGGSVLRFVSEVGGQPPLGLAEGLALAGGVLLDLVLADPADDEVLRLRVAEVPPADRGTGPHRHRLGEPDAGGLLDAEQVPELELLGV